MLWQARVSTRNETISVTFCKLLTVGCEEDVGTEELDGYIFAKKSRE
jgi:hypothetical protein